MQKYNKPVTEVGSIKEISAYCLLKLNLNQVSLMSKYDLSVDDARYVPMYEEYLEMRAHRLKVTHIISHLAEKYYVSESTVKRVVRRLSRRFTL